MRNVQFRRISVIIFFLYILTVFWYTVFKRPLAIHTAQFEPFWSYRKWFAGDTDLGCEIIANLAMFAPFGFLGVCLLRANKKPNKSAYLLIVLAGVAVSLTIETLQLALMRGMFEWDDVISNSFGTAVGIAAFSLLARLKGSGLIIRCISIVFVAVCIGVFVTERSINDVEADITPQMFFFQVDGIRVSDDKVTLDGFAVRYGHEEESPALILRSTRTGTWTRLSTIETERPEMNDYFGVDVHGFAASGELSAGEEYEAMVKWPWTVAIPVGLLIIGEDVHYYPLEELVEPKGGDLDAIVRDGILRVYRPDYHCWVYQKGWSLYWITDCDFGFEADGSTYIQYQLWTTETDKLPQERLENNYLWDNIGSYFEDYEIDGDFGAYRVMKRDIPTAYPVTAIETGYYKDGAWVWKEFFRPIISDRHSG